MTTADAIKAVREAFGRLCVTMERAIAVGADVDSPAGEDAQDACARLAIACKRHLPAILRAAEAYERIREAWRAEQLNHAAFSAVNRIIDETEAGEQ